MTSPGPGDQGGRRPPDQPQEHVSARGRSPIVWVLMVFVILMAIAYAAGVFR